MEQGLVLIAQRSIPLNILGLKEAAFYMKVNPDQVGHALGKIGIIAPKAFVFNLATIGDYINRYLNYAL